MRFEHLRSAKAVYLLFGAVQLTICYIGIRCFSVSYATTFHSIPVYEQQVRRNTVKHCSPSQHVLDADVAVTQQPSDLHSLINTVDLVAL